MKSNFYLFLLLFLVFAQPSFGQTPRKALVEHFTQASCPPCAYYNPLIAPILERNKSKAVKIAYQVSWPGYDPMNKDNPGEVQTRVNYYGVTGVPDVFLNAVSSGPPTTTITDANIQNATLIPSPFEILLENSIQPDYNSMEIKVTVKRTASSNGTPMLRVAVCEKVIEWLSPPGTNGEKEFQHVLKKFMPNTTGTNVSELDEVGESKTYTFLYKFDKLYNFKNLETVAFLQNDATKEVYQAENKELELTPNPGNDVSVKLTSATGVYGDTLVCGKRTTPILKVINTGNSVITSMDIQYSVNGGVAQNYQWTGSLNFLQEKDIPLPGIDFTPYKGSNQLEINIVKVNGQDDYSPINNLHQTVFYSAPSTTLTSTFELKPAAQPSQISFKIYDEQNAVLVEGGPFTDNTAKQYFLTLEKDRCYRIVVVNNTSSLNGTYKLFDDQNNQVFQQRVIGTGTFSRDFGTHTLVLANEDYAAENVFTAYPNPVKDLLQIKLEKPFQEAVIQLTAMNGTLIHQQVETRTTEGQEISIPVKGWISGMYFINLTTPEGQYSRKIWVY